MKYIHEVLWFYYNCSGFLLPRVSDQNRQILSENANVTISGHPVNAGQLARTKRSWPGNTTVKTTTPYAWACAWKNSCWMAPAAARAPPVRLLHCRMPFSCWETYPCVGWSRLVVVQLRKRRARPWQQERSVWPDGAIFSPCGYFWPLRGAKIWAGYF